MYKYMFHCDVTDSISGFLSSSGMVFMASSDWNRGNEYLRKKYVIQHYLDLTRQQAFFFYIY
jgi:hypothetical protein